MAFHHVALATPDIEATHRFYTEAMGFHLVKAVVAPTPEGGWAKHVFYDTGGGGMIAFWDLHVEALPTVRGAISRDLGLPEWVNHLAFDAPDHESFAASLKRWAALGLDVFDIDHEFCRSIYTVDPTGTLVEWCHDLRSLTDAERQRADAVILLTEPDRFDDEPKVEFIPGDPLLRPEWATRNHVR
ncbi:MAG TPA: VOC family protein [Microthrixaceae bacterium]|nr:VOC family protein [Microthrixaceae bacterium]HNI35880.1 VOC family protein [Microthrixaceae bacterium]